jgi:hypothetical protein
MAVLIAIVSRQFHARLPLGDAVAHGRHAPGELGHGADCAHRFLDHWRKALERMVRRQHVVIRRDNRDRRLPLLAQLELVAGRECRKAVRQVGARQCAALHTGNAGRVGMGEVSRAGRPAALDDSIGHLFNYGVQRHDRSFMNSYFEILLQNFELQLQVVYETCRSYVHTSAWARGAHPIPAAGDYAGKSVGWAASAHANVCSRAAQNATWRNFYVVNLRAVPVSFWLSDSTTSYTDHVPAPTDQYRQFPGP